MVSINYELEQAVKILLEEGADPNLPDTYDGKTAVHYAARQSKYSNCNVEVLRIVLDHGGDPNKIEVGPRREGYSKRNTPLTIAASRCLGKTKLLLERGANLNYLSEYFESPLLSSFLATSWDTTIMSYLLSIDSLDVTVSTGFTFEGDNTNIIDYLRSWVVELNSPQHRFKKRVINTLRERGLDYESAPIPLWIKRRHPQSYLDEY